MTKTYTRYEFDERINDPRVEDIPDDQLRDEVERLRAHRQFLSMKLCELFRVARRSVDEDELMQAMLYRGEENYDTTLN